MRTPFPRRNGIDENASCGMNVTRTEVGIEGMDGMVWHYIMGRCMGSGVSGMGSCGLLYNTRHGQTNLDLRNSYVFHKE